MIRGGIYSVCLAFLIISSMSLISAQEITHIISNSEDWKDVYSVIHYANLKKISNDFLVSTKHGSVLLNGLKKNKEIMVISSRTSPFVINYDSAIIDAGFAGADEITVDNANLELVGDLPDIKDFIFVEGTYGYNAIAVAPYAVLTNSWVFQADRANIDDIASILDSRKVENIMIYGFVDKEVKNALEKYNPEVIDTGDRFKDDIEITKKYLGKKPVTQVILSNGEFIEKEIMSGSGPVLFTGKENVPDQIKEYIEGSDIEIGVLIGADLVGAATNIRRSTGISVIVKFARGARTQTGGISAVEGLDLFYLPIPIMELDLYSAKYNRGTSQLELTYQSSSNIPIFFKGTITPRSESENKIRVGDIEPVFIAPNDFKTVVYSDIDFTEEKIFVDVFALYGDTPTSLEKILEKTLEVDMINIIDRCKIEIKGITYSKSKDSFIVNIKNIGEIDCWADVELSKVIIGGREKTLGSEGSKKINSGKSKKIIIKEKMDNEDLEENNFVNVIVYYGERENSLVKILKGKFELDVEFLSFATIGIIVLILIILSSLIILIILFKKRKKENDLW
ncbi:hypothetical protein BMS3Abin17_00741 [archaeon BMS3Abin17]|nr:hypothetical protein BMS3Abin17_00741 [archaeon BMS3Abin17]HDZ60886.1 hypothetical protein [Candidatus Pacearchaeota archaeon]